MKLIDILVKELPKRGGWPEGARETIEMHMDGGIFFDGNCAPDEFTLPQCSNGWAPGMGRFSNEVTRDKYESALAKNDGWIEWGGGERPVEEGALVDVRFRDGDDDRNIEAIDLLWNHENWSADIIAYRLHKPEINSRANDDRLEQDLNECIGQDVDMPCNDAPFPPEGIEIEYSTHGQKAWYRGIVTAAGESMCIVKNLSGAEQAFHKFDIEFRPLRTEAEKAREKAIAELVSVICGDVPDTGMATAAMYAERVYDAGYRKESK